MKFLTVVDMQVDFIAGSLNSELATVPIAIDVSYCAGVTMDSHNNVLNAS